MATTRDELRQLIETLSDSELTAAKAALDTLIAEREKAPLDAGDEERHRSEAVERAFGAWKGLVDPDEFKAYLAERRLVGSRPAPEL